MADYTCRIIYSAGLQLHVMLFRCLHEPYEEIYYNTFRLGFIIHGRQKGVICFLSVHVYHISPTQAAQILWQ